MNLRQYPLLLGLLLVILIAGVFRNVPSYEFVNYDDHILVYENPHLIGPRGPEFGYFWRHPHQQLYMPLTYNAWGLLVPGARLPATIIVDGTKLGLEAQPFHLLNLILHLLNALWVFAILRCLFKAEWTAFAGALFWGIHPLQAESVAWIAELKGVLAAFFALASLYFYLRGADDEETDSVSKKRLYWLLSLFCFCGALLSKPSAAALPLALLVLERGFLRRDWRHSCRALAPFFCLAVLGAIVARWAQPNVSEIPQVAWWLRPFVAGDALAFYLGRSIWPFALGINYGRRPDWLLQQNWAFLTWIPIAVLACLVMRCREAAPKAALALGVALLLPVLGFLPFVYQSYSTVADRYVYLPLLGLAMLVCWLLQRYPQRWAYSLAALWLIVLGYLGAQTSDHWKNSKSLFTQSLTVNPRDNISLFHVANYLRDEGKLAESVFYYQEAIRYKANDYSYYANLGDVLANLGRNEEAIAIFQRAVQLKPDSAKSHYNLANALAAQGNLREAEQHFRECLRLTPDLSEAENNLAITLARAGRAREAIPHWRRALQLEPGNVSAHLNLATALARQGDRNGAIAHYQAALRLNPDIRPARRALQRLRQQRLPPAPANNSKTSR